MKLGQLTKLVVTEQDQEWINGDPLDTAKAIRKKMLSVDHQADVMMGKLATWVKLAHGKVFTTTGVKSGMTLPKEVQANVRQFLTWTLTHANPNVVTKVFVNKDDPKIVLPIRALIDRHNDLTNVRADMEGRLAKLNRGKTASMGPG